MRKRIRPVRSGAKWNGKVRIKRWSWNTFFFYLKNVATMREPAATPSATHTHRVTTWSPSLPPSSCLPFQPLPPAHPVTRRRLWRHQSAGEMAPWHLGFFWDSLRWNRMAGRIRRHPPMTSLGGSVVTSSIHWRNSQAGGYGGEGVYTRRVCNVPYTPGVCECVKCGGGAGGREGGCWLQLFNEWKKRKQLRFSWNIDAPPLIFHI